MQCPACDTALGHPVVAGTELDVCDAGCGGIWFDAFELKKFDEAREDAEAVLGLNQGAGAAIKNAKRRCPACEMPMFTRFTSVKRRVQIEECPGCAGIWLDAGELEALRAEYRTQADREQAAEELFEQSAAKGMAEARAQSAERVAKAQRFANALRWLCPSNYISGKQDGAAF